VSSIPEFFRAFSILVLGRAIETLFESYVPLPCTTVATMDPLTAHLAAMGIGPEAAAAYSVALEEDGFDTAESFAALTLDELQSDFSFKRGHLRMVAKARETAAPAALSLGPPAQVLHPRVEGDASPPDGAPEDSTPSAVGEIVAAVPPGGTVAVVPANANAPPPIIDGGQATPANDGNLNSRGNPYPENQEDLAMAGATADGLTYSRSGPAAGTPSAVGEIVAAVPPGGTVAVVPANANAPPPIIDGGQATPANDGNLNSRGNPYLENQEDLAMAGATADGLTYSSSGPAAVGPAKPVKAKAPAEREYDFFINHCQASGQDQCGKLDLLLKARGCKVWYDMAAKDLTAQGMEEGVANSRNVLIFLSKGIMGRPFCQMEQRWGKKYNCKFVGVVELDPRHDPADFAEEKAAAPPDLQHLLDDVEFETYQRRNHLVDAMMTKIMGDGGVQLSRVGSSPATMTTTVADQIMSCDSLAAACGASLSELVSSFSLDEVKELLGEQEAAGCKVGILGRKRILAEFTTRLSAGVGTAAAVVAAAPHTVGHTNDDDDDKDDDEAEELDPWIMIIGNEEQRIILAHLCIGDVGSMAAVSRHWRTIVSDDFVWETLCGRDFHIDSLPAHIPTFRTQYRTMLEFMRLPGLCLEVLDTYNIWSVARVLLVLDQHRFLVWFEGWGDEWLMWLDSRFDLARIRPCQSAVAGLGKRGPLQYDTITAKQTQCLDCIAQATMPTGTTSTDARFLTGDLVEAQYPSGRWYPATIVEVHGGGEFVVDWSDGDGDHRRRSLAQLRRRQAPTPVTASVFPSSCVWRVPAAATPGVHSSPYCPGWGVEGADLEVQEHHDLEDPRRVVRGFAGKGGVARPFRPLLPAEVAPEPWVVQQQAAMQHRPFRSCFECSSDAHSHGVTPLPRSLDFQAHSGGTAAQGGTPRP
jgi:hypothetical protein